MESGWKKGRKEGKERDETKELTDLSSYFALAPSGTRTASYT